MKPLQPSRNFAPALLILFLAAMPLASAAECGHPPPPPPRGEMKGPPPFDPALCKDKAAGTVIEVTTPDGRAMRGTCQLVFLPARPARQENPR